MGDRTLEPVQPDVNHDHPGSTASRVHRMSRTWRGRTQRDWVFLAIGALSFVGFLAALVQAKTGMGLAHIDDSASEWAESSSGAWLTLANVLGTVGDNEPMLATFLLAGTTLWWNGHRREAIAGVSAFLLTQAIVHTLKPVLALPRPRGALELSLGYGFPSGHTATAAVVGTLAIWACMTNATRAWRATAVVAAATWTCAMAWSRLATGAHYLSDVVGGAMLGIAVAALTLPLTKLGARQVDVSVPIPVTNGARAETPPSTRKGDRLAIHDGCGGAPTQAENAR